MNKKIFTLLAVACMLLTTAYHVNARSVADRSVGALVTSLPEGQARGMYHIVVDSICLMSGGVPTWFPVTWDGNIGSPKSYVSYVPGTSFDYQLIAPGVTPNFWDLADTIMLSVTEHGEVVLVSARDLRRHLSAGTASLTDLQASMWCIDILRHAEFQYGNWPTFTFTNKVFDMDLDFTAGTTYVQGSGRGWMYSSTHENNQLHSRQPLFRRMSDGKYNVLAAWGGTGTTSTNTSVDNMHGKVFAKEVDIDDYVIQNVPGMLKVSIMEVSPLILTADEFNTKLGNDTSDNPKPVKLNFDKETTIDNPFSYYLRTHKSDNPTAASYDYLNVEVFENEDDAVSQGFIANKNTAGGDQYNNAYSIQYLNLHKRPRTESRTSDKDAFNYSYRFVYFPSDDSLVVNAFYAKHNSHSEYGNFAYEDVGAYTSDQPGDYPYWYGLYDTVIHTALIVRFQDLSGINGAASMMTVGRHPANVRLYFGISGCQALWDDAWVPRKGVYTIWDERGRCLGVRMYNGTYSPQWIQLENDFECPDRIPSYQWVVEPENTGGATRRVKITNREFGSFYLGTTSSGREIVRMLNVLIRQKPTRIFATQHQFSYNPLVPSQNYIGYEPIWDGYVRGQYLDVIKNAADCGTNEKEYKNNGGFRPVFNAYLAQKHLGYKHFIVGTDPGAPNYGKSEDANGINGVERGMDYNAFAFNHFTYVNAPENQYITLTDNYGDEMLQVETDKKTGFQFMLGTDLRHSSNQYREEAYGYPLSDQTSGWGPPHYPQPLVPLLKRYFYELKEADFYNYRDGLAEKFVVLKGAKTNDYADIHNAMKYGVCNYFGLADPFKFANVYLRETYFVTRPWDKKSGEERNIADTTRRILYTVMDRIEISQVQNLIDIGDFEISDTLYMEDGSEPFQLVTWDVDQQSGFIKARGKVASARNTSVFSLENFQYELYRRLNSPNDDTANSEGDGIDQEAGASQTDAITGEPLNTNFDAPKILRIERDRSDHAEFLYEDANSQFSQNKFDMGGKQINFLGVTNIWEDKEKLAPDGTIKFCYNLFVDTAYINRGTGPIKPQYLIAVGVDVVNTPYVIGYNKCDERIETPLEPYVIGRYLVNATDSARKVGSNGDGHAEMREPFEISRNFVTSSSWDRLVFVEAIHIHDRLYIISELDKALRAADIDPGIYRVVSELDNKEYIDGKLLRSFTEYNVNPKLCPLYGKARVPGKSDMLGVYYDFEQWDNYHNDVCFSLRFTHGNVKNAKYNWRTDTMVEGSNNYEKRFFIESETTNRNPFGNRKIAPVQGGWIMLQNMVPVLSRTAYGDPIQQAEVFNISEPPFLDPYDNGGLATQNDNAGASVSVIAGDGVVTIFNADGKQVKIANMLGQTLANKVLAGNKAAISVPAGIAVVTVEGEKAVKVIIK